MKLLNFLLPFAFCLFLFSCGDFKDVTFSGIENLKVIKLSQEGVEAEITAKIKNPNHVGFKIYKSDFDVTLGGMNAGKAHLTDVVKIKANSEKEYVFKIKSDFSSLSLTDIPKIISMAMSKTVKVGLKGDLKVGKLLVKKLVPVEVNKSVPLEFLK